MLRIDAHHHFWKFNSAEYGWISDTMPELRRDFLPADLLIETTRAEISGVVSVQARQTIEETRWLLELASQHGFIKGVVGWLPLTDPQVGGLLERFAADQNFKGVRHVLQDEANENYMLDAAFNRGVSELKQFHLAYDILIFERHLPQTITFVDRHPNQIFVVDHLAKPRVKYKALSPWRENLHELAKRTNVYCKISGLATEADHKQWTEAQLAPYIATVLDSFGPSRTMFGSDWPVCLLAIGYQQWVSLVTKTLSKLSKGEQERIWSGTAVEAYRLRI